MFKRKKRRDDDEEPKKKTNEPEDVDEERPSLETESLDALPHARFSPDGRCLDARGDVQQRSMHDAIGAVERLPCVALVVRRESLGDVRVQRGDARRKEARFAARSGRVG